MINFKESKFYILYILVALVIFIFYSWLQDIFFGEEVRVRKFILRGKNMVETKNILTCSNMISRDYHDKYGNDRDSLIYFTKEFFGYYRKIFGHIESMKIELDDAKKNSLVEIVALVVGQTQDENEEKILEGEKGRFRIRLVKEEQEWKLLELEFFEPIKLMDRYIS